MPCSQRDERGIVVSVLLFVPGESTIEGCMMSRREASECAYYYLSIVEIAYLKVGVREWWWSSLLSGRELI